MDTGARKMTEVRLQFNSFLRSGRRQRPAGGAAVTPGRAAGRFGAVSGKYFLARARQTRIIPYVNGIILTQIRLIWRNPRYGPD
jgi:hypothetical protein